MFHGWIKSMGLISSQFAPHPPGLISSRVAKGCLFSIGYSI